MRALLALAAVIGAAAIAAGPAGAADECKGLRVCLPVAGPWVVVPAGAAGVDWELTCPLPGYTVAGTDARVATRDVDVSIFGRTGSPVGPGVTTGRSVVFHALRTSAERASSSFQPFAGCIPGAGGGGRSLTAHAAGIKPSDVVESVVVTARVTRTRQIVRASCPVGRRLVGATHAVGFVQETQPTAAQRSSVAVRRVTPGGTSVAVAVAARAPADGRARVQVRALCTRSR